MGTLRSAMPDRLHAVAVAQGGVVSREQVLAGGMSRSALRSRIRSQRWQPVYRGIYAIFTGPLDRRSRLWAAVLYAGEGAVLSHETAGELHNLLDQQDSLIHVTVRHGRQIRPVPGLVVHRSRRNAAVGLKFPEGQLPRANVEETILDVAEGMEKFDDVCALVTRAFARSLTSAEFMRFALAQRQRQKWRGEIDELITAGAGGAHSVLEFRYDRDVEKAHGLPLSRHQVPFTKKNGHRGYRDRVYEDYDVIVELDGKQTHTADKQWEDKSRDNAAAEGGEQSLRYAWKDVRWNSCATALQIAGVLRLRGWTGPPVPCSPECAARAKEQVSPSLTRDRARRDSR